MRAVRRDHIAEGAGRYPCRRECRGARDESIDDDRSPVACGLDYDPDEPGDLEASHGCKCIDGALGDELAVHLERLAHGLALAFQPDVVNPCSAADHNQRVEPCEGAD